MLRMILLLAIAVNVNAYEVCPDGNTPSSTPMSRFIIFEDRGLVVDPTTQLMWKRCFEGSSGPNCSIDAPAPEGIETFQDVRANPEVVAQYHATFSFNHQEAMVRASESSYAGYNDWRVPNAKEMLSIYDTNCAVFTLYPESSVLNIRGGDGLFANWNFAVFPLVEGEATGPYWSSTLFPLSQRGFRAFAFAYEDRRSAADVDMSNNSKLRLVRSATPNDIDFQPALIQ